MSWLKVDDDFYSHEKVLKLAEGPCEDAALALWLKVGSWAAHAENGGRVPRGVAIKMAGHPEAASELVRVGLWEVTEAGYLFHDWADYQPSGEALQERRKKGAERKAESRARLSSKKKQSSDVGVSQRDCVSVTGLPRDESRPRLASASRDRDREGSGNSSSEISEQPPIHFRAPLGDPPPHLHLEREVVASSPKRSDASVINDLYAEFQNKLPTALGRQDPDAPREIAAAVRAESGDDDRLFREVARRIFSDWKADKRSATHQLANLAKHIGLYTRERKAPPKPIVVPLPPPPPVQDAFSGEDIRKLAREALALSTKGMSRASA